MPGKPTPFFDDFYKQVASKSIKLETKIYNQFYLMVILFLCELVSLTFFILNQFGFGILLLITLFLSICLWWINKNLEMLFQEKYMMFFTELADFITKSNKNNKED